MDGDDALTLVLRDFARNMLTDFSIQTILNNLVERIVEVLSVTGAGVTLISPGAAPHYVAASDGRALRFEQLQSSLAEGPCVSAYQSGEPVAVPDLAQDKRDPRFGVAAGTIRQPTTMVTSAAMIDRLYPRRPTMAAAGMEAMP